MTGTSTPPRLIDLEPRTRSFRDEVIWGLDQPRKELPCKFFYDDRGSRLFEEICELEEYYPTRTELGIMKRNVPEIARLLGRDCFLIEYGSGASRKTRLLLDHLESPAAYVPIDISRDILLRSCEALSRRHPDLEIVPVCGDYTRKLSLPTPRHDAARRVVYFPGSTIGNFHPARAETFLRRIRDRCGEGGGLLVGVDLKKDRAVLERAYDDERGVTAAFNRNLLVRINRELDANFDVDRFRHLAYYNESRGRIEMHLVSECEQEVRVGDRSFIFKAGESIHTENSYKYDLDEFAALAALADLSVHKVWTDERSFFSVQYLKAERRQAP